MNQFSLQSKILTMLGIIAAGGLLFVFVGGYYGPLAEEGEGNGAEIRHDAWANEEALNTLLKGSGQSAANASGSSRESTAQGGALSQTYTNNEYGFSLRYPKDFKVGEFESGESTNIVIQNAEQGLGIQIYVTPLNEPIAITKTQIEKDVPDMTVENAQPIVIGESENPSTESRAGGLAFISENDRFGESREVWFTYNKILYQVSTYASLDPLLQQMMGTWEFKE